MKHDVFQAVSPALPEIIQFVIYLLVFPLWAKWLVTSPMPTKYWNQELLSRRQTFQRNVFFVVFSTRTFLLGPLSPPRWDVKLERSRTSGIFLDFFQVFVNSKKDSGRWFIFEIWSNQLLPSQVITCRLHLSLPSKTIWSLHGSMTFLPRPIEMTPIPSSVDSCNYSCVSSGSLLAHAGNTEVAFEVGLTLNDPKLVDENIHAVARLSKLGDSLCPKLDKTWKTTGYSYSVCCFVRQDDDSPRIIDSWYLLQKEQYIFCHCLQLFQPRFIGENILGALKDNPGLMAEVYPVLLASENFQDEMIQQLFQPKVGLFTYKTINKKNQCLKTD